MPSQLAQVGDITLARARGIALMHTLHLHILAVRARDPENSSDFRPFRTQLPRTIRRCYFKAMEPELGVRAPRRRATRPTRTYVRVLSAGAAMRGLTQIGRRPPTRSSSRCGAHIFPTVLVSAAPTERALLLLHCSPDVGSTTLLPDFDADTRANAGSPFDETRAIPARGGHVLCARELWIRLARASCSKGARGSWSRGV